MIRSFLQSIEDADEALKELFDPIFESLFQGEMNHHLGYEMMIKIINKGRIAEMDIVKKLIILQREISRSLHQEIVMALLKHR